METFRINISSEQYKHKSNSFIFSAHWRLHMAHKPFVVISSANMCITFVFSAVTNDREKRAFLPTLSELRRAISPVKRRVGS